MKWKNKRKVYIYIYISTIDILIILLYLCYVKLNNFYSDLNQYQIYGLNPDGNVRVANMGPTWVLVAPGGPHVGPMNIAIRVVLEFGLSLPFM